MKVIDFDTIKKLNINPVDCYNWVTEVIENKYEMLLPAKISMKPAIEGVFYNCMPSILPMYGWGGVKLVTRYPQRIPSLKSEIILYDLKDGNPIAFMDGTYITAMRTGAVAAHSIKLFALKNFDVMGFIGLGNTARATLKVLLAIMPDRKFHIKLLKYKNQHLLFAEEFKSNKIKFLYCDTPQQVIVDSDIIVSASTVFNEDICENEYFKEGCLVVPIHTRGFTNCDLFFDRIFADDTNHVKNFKYFSQFKNFAEIAAVVNGKALGRESNQERILAYNIGISLHDIYFAGKIATMVKKTVEVDLKQPTDKFWV